MSVDPSKIARPQKSGGVRPIRSAAPVREEPARDWFVSAIGLAIAGLLTYLAWATTNLAPYELPEGAGEVQVRSVPTTDGSSCYVLLSEENRIVGFSCVGNAVKAPPKAEK